MTITALLENTSAAEGLGCEHGLSLYIETGRHKLLFDMGAGSLFAENAEKLGVDLTAVDTAVISHGHHDHGGGLETFLSLNDSAVIYVRESAFEGHYAVNGDSVRNVGLEAHLKGGDRFVFTGRHHVIDTGLELFSDVGRLRLNPSCNHDLHRQAGDARVPDDFAHEHSLLIREEGKTVLVAGCAHCGIVNILDHLFREEGLVPDVVIGGFHLFNPSDSSSEHPETVAEIARELLKAPTQYYTCHCTGPVSYGRLKDAMGDKIDYLAGGRTLTL